VATEVLPLVHKAARWLREPAGERQLAQLPHGTIPCLDPEGRQVLLFEGDWEVNYMAERYPELTLEQLA
jgi:peptide subunit release factor RF-3